MKLEFFDTFLKNTQISNFMKIQPVGAELFHADRQTQTMKLTVVFHNFTNTPKNNTTCEVRCDCLTYISLPWQQRVLIVGFKDIWALSISAILLFPAL